MMAETKLKRELTLKKRVDNFLFSWNQFPIDYWWRKKYNVPFGSPQHREMSFIDMYIEYQEEIELTKALTQPDIDEDEAENEALGLVDTNKKVVKVTEKEIDEDFDNLDLSQFDKQE